MINIRKYGFYRIGAVSPELRIADTEFNSDIICEILQKFGKCDLYVFPELSITGYSCQDLFFQRNLIDGVHSAIKKICVLSQQTNTTLIVGAPLISENRLYNTAIVISSGIIAGVVPKSFLCNYIEYYEKRWFASEFDRISQTIEVADQKVPFGADLIFENINDRRFKFGIEICEDLWAVNPPSVDLALAGCVAIANLSASNEYLGKSSYRQDNVRMQSGRLLSAYIYSAAGMWESTSDSVFSGKSMICESGKLLSAGIPYSQKSEICISDIDIESLINDRIKNNTFASSRPSKDFRIIGIEMVENEFDDLKRKVSRTPFVPPETANRNIVCSEITDIQITSLSRRMLHIGCHNVIIGVSGGLDSTLALLVSYKVFQKLNLDVKGIIAVTMPGFGTTKRTKNNAVVLAEKLGITLIEISIEESVRLHFKEINHDENNHNVVYENAQARKRTHILMDLANKYNGIVIGTGDLSESALGWCTFSGDHISMYGINSGVPKTLVKYLIKWYGNDVFDGEISKILSDISETPISPELLPPDINDNITQETENSIGPYLLHDFFLYYFIRHNFSSQRIQFLAELVFADEFDKSEINKTLNLFFKRFFENQFKRNAVPDGPKVGTVSLSPRSDWRMPSDANYNLWINR
jgi:NAD+ synthase (glutamine-hydrolysing)